MMIMTANPEDIAREDLAIARSSVAISSAHPQHHHQDHHHDIYLKPNQSELHLFLPENDFSAVFKRFEKKRFDQNDADALVADFDENDAGERNLPEERLEPVERFLQYLHHPQAFCSPEENHLIITIC